MCELEYFARLNEVDVFSVNFGVQSSILNSMFNDYFGSFVSSLFFSPLVSQCFFVEKGLIILG
jgi:hypothetical protein